jgi:hypothetical protein
MNPVRCAYANARVRAMKSRLIDCAAAAAIRAGHPLHGLPADLGQDPATITRGLYEDLGRLVAWLTRAYPDGAAVFLQFLRLHETENLKLIWRRALRDRRGVLDGWRPLGPLASLRQDDWAAARPLKGVVGALAATPFGAIAASVHRTCGADLADAEHAFDAWATADLAKAAALLPPGEREAARLIELVVAERRLALARRIAAARLRPSAGRATPASLRQARRDACLRAFRGYPFCLAPPVALLLLRDAQVQALISLVEARGRRSTAPLERVLGALLTES